MWVLIFWLLLLRRTFMCEIYRFSTTTTITCSTLYYHCIYNRIQNWCIIWLKETLAIITLIIAPNGKNFIAMQVSIAHDLLHVGRVCSINF